MREVKMIEVRDRMTLMPVLAVRVTGGQQDPLLWRAGYGDWPYTILIRLDTMEANHDPFNWKGGARTIPEAHRYLHEHWGEFPDNSVLDVEYVLGETQDPKQSDVRK